MGARDRLTRGLRARGLLPPAPARPRKFHNAPAVDALGVMYDSTLERDVALRLREQEARGEIWRWCWGPRFLVSPPRSTPITYRPDFIVYPNDRPWYALDAKGVMTREFRLKAKLWQALFPGHPLYIVGRDGQQREAPS